MILLHDEKMYWLLDNYQCQLKQASLVSLFLFMIERKFSVMFSISTCVLVHQYCAFVKNYMYHLGKKLARIDNGYQSQLLSFLSSSVCINYRTDNSKFSHSQKQINYHKLASRFNCQRYLNSSFSNLELFLFLTPTFLPLSTTSVYSLLSCNTSPVTSDEN